MKKQAVTVLAGQGHVTLQVPGWAIVEDGISESDEEKFFTYLKGHRPAAKRENGYYYFTRAGYKHFKPALKEAFEKSPRNRGPNSWADFEKFAKQHFKGVKDSTALYKKNLVAKLAELRRLEKLL